MDFQKDANQNIRHLESKTQGQFSQSDNSATLLKSADDFAGHIKRSRYFFVQKKSEKLVAAIYLVTGFLSDSEPLKWDMRKVSLSILSDIVSIGSLAVSDTDVRIKKVSSDIGKISALLEVAKVAGFISEMNCVILLGEYRMLATLAVSEQPNLGKKNFVFSRDFFAADETSQSASEHHGSDPDIYKGHVKDKTNNVLYNNPVTKVADSVSHSPLNSVLVENTTPKKNEKNSRRELILDLIKEKNEVSIKDIVSHFSDCGEKTIQRELSVLVLNGALKKVGDRRWSKYMLSGHSL